MDKDKKQQTATLWIRKKKVIINLHDEADRMVDWFLKTTKRALITQYSIDRGYPKLNLYRWAERNEYFKTKFDLIKDIQEQRLLQGALRGTYESKIAALALMQHHGYKTANMQQGGSTGSQQVQIIITKNFTGNTKDDKVDVQTADTATAGNRLADKG